MILSWYATRDGYHLLSCSVLLGGLVNRSYTITLITADMAVILIGKGDKVKIGIIGGGSFGQFMARVFVPYHEVFICSRRTDIILPDVDMIPFENLASMDCIILAIPLEAHQSVLARLRPMLRPETLVVDVCSVKVRSREILLHELSGHPNMLICHPLFGPQSAATGTQGHQLIVTDAMGDAAHRMITFCQGVLGLQVTHVTAEEHDQAMAYVHVLTFFVARGLGNMNIAQLPFVTPSFQYLQDLINLDHQHSDELFMTIQTGNPFGAKVRSEVVQALGDLEQSLA